MLQTRIVIALVTVGLLAGCQSQVSMTTPVSMTVQEPYIVEPGSVFIGPPEPTYPFENPVNLGKDFRRSAP